MGFMDGFTSDGTVDMKHTEYYNLMREATKAELIGNAVKADVPGFYIQAMITGKKPEFLNTLDAEDFLTRSMYPGKEVGRTYPCELWKSAKGNWLLTHEEDYSTYGEAIQEEEAKSLLMRHATDIYEKMFGELPEA